MKAILERRSIRKYSQEPIPDEQIKMLLEAAVAAPSAGNAQPWHFIVINEREILDKITQVHPHAQMLKQAPVAIMVCGNPELELYPGYWIQDCSAATQNILIAAQHLGLGSVWLGVFPREDRVGGLRDLLGIPANIMPFSMIAVGYADEQKNPSNRFDPERIHKNHW